MLKAGSAWMTMIASFCLFSTLYFLSISIFAAKMPHIMMRFAILINISLVSTFNLTGFWVRLPNRF